MLTGTEKIIRQAIEGAASKSKQIEFVDPAHNALLQELKQKSLVTREIIRRQEERQQRAEQAKTAEKKTAAAAVEVDAKFPVPGKSLEPVMN